KESMGTLILVELGLILGCLFIGCLLLWLANEQTPQLDHDRLARKRLLEIDDGLLDSRHDNMAASMPTDSVREVMPVAPEVAHGVTSQRPVERLAPPRMDSSLDDGPRRAATDMYAARVDPPETPRRTMPSPVVILTAVVLFFVVAISGVFLMR